MASGLISDWKRVGTYKRLEMQMKKKKQSSVDKRRGVAIIMVLGLLAVLMIAAMAFSISMRVERQGAASFRNSMQSRHMLFAALGRAMEDITGQMVTSNSFQIYPPFAVLASRGDGVFTNEDTRARMLTRKALEFLPDDLAGDVMAAPAYWHTIENSEGTIVGRYAFVAADCSGWIDVNHAGGQDRLRGVSPTEIQIDHLDGVLGEARLLDERNNNPFETFRELTALGEEYGFLDSNVKDLFTFSLSPGGEFLHNQTNRLQVYIGTNRSEWSEQDILNAFQECPMKAAYDAGLTYSNFLDYVDEDLVPTNLADGHIDMAPMFNEVVFYYKLGVESNGQYTIPHGFEPVMQLECMYPFREFSEESYSLEYELNFEKKAGNTHDELIPADISDSWHFDADDKYKTKDVYGSDSSGNIGTNDFTLSFTAELKIRLKEASSSSNLVDQVPYPDFSGSPGFVFEVDREVSPGDDFRITNWVECVDPRFNGNPDKVDRWVPGRTIQMFHGADKEPTIGKTNTVTLAVFDSGNMAYDAKADGDTALYIANTNLQTVGELGNICLDRPWHTVGLYKHSEWPDYDHVIDWFTTRKKGFQKGLVNINSFNPTGALAAVFTYVPIEEYDPVFPISDREIDQSVAEDIANEIWSKGPYTNMSELGRLNWGDWVSGEEVDKEAPLRNSVGLLTTRQNIFTIILAADSYAEPVGGLREGHYGSVRARARAIAVVWRDPWPDDEGKHQYFLRYFDLLRE